MHRPLLSLLAALPLMACGGTATDGNATANAAAPDNGYIKRMAALNEGERNGVLFRAIRDAGRTCQGVVRSQPADAEQGRPAWLATCDDQGEWLVAIGGDGTATVTDARALAGARDNAR